MFDLREGTWINQPQKYAVDSDRVEITTAPVTGLWNETYYSYDDFSAHMLVKPVSDEYFTFGVKVECDSKYGFDGGGIVILVDEKNWVKIAAEYGDENEQFLGSVVTGGGYSDWASIMIDADIKTVWYRLSRIKGDFFLEYSLDGVEYRQMRIFHLNKGEGEVRLGVYACSPDESTCTAVFTEMEMGECIRMPE